MIDLASRGLTRQDFDLLEAAEQYACLWEIVCDPSSLTGTALAGWKYPASHIQLELLDGVYKLINQWAGKDQQPLSPVWPWDRSEAELEAEGRAEIRSMQDGEREKYEKLMLEYSAIPA